MRVRIKVMGAPWPCGAGVGDVVDLGPREAVPGWALGKCVVVGDDEPTSFGCGAAEQDAKSAAEAEAAALKAEAEDLGIRVDGRWSPARLAEEVAKAKAKAAK